MSTTTITTATSAEPEIHYSSCLCGKNRISYTGPPLLKFKCHCLDERKLTGATFALNILFSSASLTTISGTLTTFTKKVDSGNDMTNHLCGECGSLLYRSSSWYSGSIVVKAGCMDDVDGGEKGKGWVEGFKPDVEVFVRSRASWVQPIEGVKQEEGDFSA